MADFTFKRFLCSSFSIFLVPVGIFWFTFQFNFKFLIQLYFLLRNLFFHIRYLTFKDLYLISLSFLFSISFSLPFLLWFVPCYLTKYSACLSICLSSYVCLSVRLSFHLHLRFWLKMKWQKLHLVWMGVSKLTSPLCIPISGLEIRGLSKQFFG